MPGDDHMQITSVLLFVCFRAQVIVIACSLARRGNRTWLPTIVLFEDKRLKSTLLLGRDFHPPPVMFTSFTNGWWPCRNRASQLGVLAPALQREHPSAIIGQCLEHTLDSQWLRWLKCVCSVQSTRNRQERLVLFM